jgi:hypothetical protein
VFFTSLLLADSDSSLLREDSKQYCWEESSDKLSVYQKPDGMIGFKVTFENGEVRLFSHKPPMFMTNGERDFRYSSPVLLSVCEGV